MSRKEHTIDHTSPILISLSCYTIQSRVYMLISRSLHRIIRNISSSDPFNFQITRSISTKMATSQTATIPQAQRMFDGGTHKLDVWSIFTYVSFAHINGPLPLFPSSIFMLFTSTSFSIRPLYSLVARAQPLAASPS